MSPLRKAMTVIITVAVIAALLTIQIIPPYAKPFSLQPTVPTPTATTPAPPVDWRTVYLKSPSPVVTRVLIKPGPTKTVTRTKTVVTPGPTKTVIKPGPTKTVTRTIPGPVQTVTKVVIQPAPVKTVIQRATSILPSRSEVRVPLGSPKEYAASLVGATQFLCLNLLWNRESGWNTYASNPSSGAYGIPQALPGSKMASAGSDWQTNPRTQIRWGLSYISGRYGTPCGAWAHSQATGWY